MYIYGQKCLSLNGKPASRASDFSETEPYLSEPQYLFVTSFGRSRDVRWRYWWQTPSVVNLQSDCDGWFHNNFTHLFVSRSFKETPKQKCEQLSNPTTCINCNSFAICESRSGKSPQVRCQVQPKLLEHWDLSKLNF